MMNTAFGKRRGRFGVALAVLAFALTAAPSGAADVTKVPPSAMGKDKFVEIPATPEIMARLRAGGFVLYLRHGYTDNTRSDRLPVVDFGDCSTQRPLTDAGRRLAAGIGASIRAAGIPLADIHISPLCRVRDTAAAAFPNGRFTIDDKLMYVANLTDAEKAPIIANTRRLLSAPVAPGSNRMLVAHGPNLVDLTGYFPKEGTLAVFLPKGEAGFEYIASIPPGLWPDLLQQAKTR